MNTISSSPLSSTSVVRKGVFPTLSSPTRSKTIWIDLDNSPHVPFFKPIITQLANLGYTLCITGRDCFQVRDLVNLAELPCTLIGQHWGKHRCLKIAGTAARAIQLTSFARRRKPDLAVSHGSRSQILAAKLLHVRTLMIDDYEGSQRGIDPDWLLVPEVIPEQDLRMRSDRILRYPGIKEDVYVPFFQPDSRVRDVLGIHQSDTVVTVRPPASEAHYHNPESDVLYEELLDFLIAESDTKIVLLPRSPQQGTFAKQKWKEAYDNQRLLIPKRAIDGLSLIWFSDFVVSGGGTMNREAASLGVPVYSIFRGPCAAVDRYLVATGKLTFLESVPDIRQKIKILRRSRPLRPGSAKTPALEAIVNQLICLTEPDSKVWCRPTADTPGTATGSQERQSNPLPARPPQSLSPVDNLKANSN